MPLTQAGSLDPRGGRSCALWHRLLRRSASESGRLRQGAGDHSRAARAGRVLMLPTLRMSTLHARGRLGLNEDFHHERILGTVLTGRLITETQVGPYPAVVPTLSGQAWITGFASYVVDPSDPFPEGFTLGDIW